MNLQLTRYPSIPGIHIITIHHRKSTANSPAFSIYYFQHANTGTVFQRASILVSQVSTSSRFTTTNQQLIFSPAFSIYSFQHSNSRTVFPACKYQYLQLGEDGRLPARIGKVDLILTSHQVHTAFNFHGFFNHAKQLRMNFQPTRHPRYPSIHIINTINITITNQQLIFPSFFHLLFSTRTPIHERYFQRASILIIHIITIHHHKSTANFPQLFPFTIFNTQIHGRYFQRASINIFNWVNMVDYQLELDKVDLILTSHQVSQYPSIHIIERSTTANQQLIFPSFFHLLFSTLQFTDAFSIYYFQHSNSRTVFPVCKYIQLGEDAVDYHLELDKVDLILTSHQVSQYPRYPRYPSIHIIELSTTTNQQLIFSSFFHLLFSTLQFTDGISSVQVSISSTGCMKMVDYQLELDKVDLILTSHQVHTAFSFHGFFNSMLNNYV
ncbi:unnamed protein product [Ambrosiozyma monospora]|uniref:Unnamed protein product n=1 Tax=Ambrosiozyma monospora TaxID=43982 RepID=A0A9W7DH94_AMBMO|nr:unnamed protein product [Ambrosiozyma monospora]